MQTVTGRVPYYGHNDAEFSYLIKTQEPEIPSDIPEPLGGIIRGCLLKDRTLRPTASQLRDMLRDAPRKPIDIGAGSVLVGPGGRYRSIAEAVAEVTEGARIYVQPGVYPGTLRLKREVEIHGLSAVADVVIDGRGDPCVVADAPEAVVRGVTLRSNAREGFGAEGGPEPAARASASAGPRPTRRSDAVGFAAAWRRASPWPRRRKVSSRTASWFNAAVQESGSATMPIRS